MPVFLSLIVFLEICFGVFTPAEALKTRSFEAKSTAATQHLAQGVEGVYEITSNTGNSYRLAIMNTQLDYGIIASLYRIDESFQVYSFLQMDVVSPTQLSGTSWNLGQAQYIEIDAHPSSGDVEGVFIPTANTQTYTYSGKRVFNASRLPGIAPPETNNCLEIGSGQWKGISSAGKEIEVIVRKLPKGDSFIGFFHFVASDVRIVFTQGLYDRKTGILRLTGYPGGQPRKAHLFLLGHLESDRWLGMRMSLGNSSYEAVELKRSQNSFL